MGWMILGATKLGGNRHLDHPPGFGFFFGFCEQDLEAKPSLAHLGFHSLAHLPSLAHFTTKFHSLAHLPEQGGRGEHGERGGNRGEGGVHIGNKGGRGEQGGGRGVHIGNKGGRGEQGGRRGVHIGNKGGREQGGGGGCI